MRREKIHNVEDLYVMQAIIKSHDSISLALILTWLVFFGFSANMINTFLWSISPKFGVSW